jgi:hypothetical protein
VSGALPRKKEFISIKMKKKKGTNRERGRQTLR